MPSASILARLRRPAASPATLAIGLAGLGLLAWAVVLWPRWREDPDLSHGFFALPLVFMLWRRAQEDSPDDDGPPGRHLALVAALALALPAAAGLASVYVAALGWSEPIALSLFSIAAGLGAAIAVALAAAPGERRLGLGWAATLIPVIVALSAPLPPGTYARLTIGLQEWITVAVLETLRLFGVPAMRVGNIIHLGHASVGVEEACSGVRSLVSCVIAGLVMSALLLRSPWRRALLLACAAPLALATNYLRSLTLTLLARRGVDISDGWHDWLGFGVLGLTTLALGWIAFSLEEPARPAATHRPSTGTSRAPGLIAFFSIFISVGWLGFVALRTAPPSAPPPAPDLARWTPAKPVAAGWSTATRDDLERFSGVLHTDALIERTYLRRDSSGRLDEITLYLAYWAPGASTVSAVATHTPDVCWPGAGWTALPDRVAKTDLPLADGRTLTASEQRGFAFEGSERWIWYWHLVDGSPSPAFEPRSWRDQLARFMREGVPPARPQLFVRLSSNLPWPVLATEPLMAELAACLAEAGVPMHRAGLE